MKNVERKRFIWICSVLLAITMIQCSGTKRLVSGETNGASPDVEELEDINTLVITSYKLQIDEENEWSGKLRGYIKAIRGEGVMISLRRGMNIEVARMWIKNDTLTILNRVDRMVKIIDVERYLGECRVMLKNDWAMFLLMGKNPVKDRFIKEKDKGDLSMLFHGCEIEVEVEGGRKTTKRIEVRRLHNEIIIKYENGKKGKEVQLPKKIELDVNTDEIKVRCMLEFEDYIINRETEMKVKIPAGYHR